MFLPHCRRPQSPWPASILAALALVLVLHLTPVPDARAAVLQDAGGYAGISFASMGAPFGTGVSFVDLDGDYDLDIFLINGTGQPNRLYLNQGGFSFVEVPGAWGASNFGNSRAATFGDIDNDGDKDLFLTTLLASNVLYRNDGGVFTNITAAAGITADTYASCGVSMADVNNDGFLDIYVANRGWVGTEPNQLWVNDGDGTFTNMAAAWGVATHHLSFQSVFTDYDSDGDVDLYVTSDRMTRNDLYRNDLPAGFTDISDGSGADLRINGMGVATADLNADGVTDFLVTNTREGHACVVSDGPEHWTEMAVSLGVAGYQSGWGAHFFDVDNDADEDLFLAHGAGVNYSWDTYNMLLLNEGWGNPFTDISSTLIVNDPDNRSFGLAVGDLDGDGLMDVFATNVGAVCEFYQNVTPNAGNWIQIIPVGTVSNRDGIGAKIVVEAGGVTQWREIRAGASYLSQMDGIAHFGLGEATEITALTIYWPSGIIQAVDAPALNQILVVEEGAVSSSIPADLVSRPVLQMAPNPFHNRLRMATQLLEPGTPTLRVIDATGRLVAQRSYGPQQAGPIEVVWDGRDRHGHRVAPGAYWIELQSGSQRAVEKVVAVR